MLDVTFADTPFEEGMDVLAQVLGCTALAGLGNLVERSHDLPSRPVPHAGLDVILEPAPQRQHCWLPVDDLTFGQRRLVGTIFNDEGRERGAMLLSCLLPPCLALRVVRVQPLDDLACGDGGGLRCGRLL